MENLTHDYGDDGYYDRHSFDTDEEAEQANAADDIIRIIEGDW